MSDLENKKKVELFAQARTHLPKSVMRTVEDISAIRKMPISRLIAVAIANELETQKPFTYDVELPETTDATYTSKAAKIYQYLKLCGNGMDKKLLVIARNDMGIEDKDEFLKALKLLFDEKMIEQVDFRPSWCSYIEKRIMVVDREKKTKKKKRKGP